MVFAASEVIRHPLMSKEAYGRRVIQSRGLAALDLTPGVKEAVAKAAWNHDLALLERACAGQMFENVSPLKYEGPDSKNPVAFKAYDPKMKIDGETTLEDYLRISVAFWHAFRGTGADPFGGGTIGREWDGMFDPLAQGTVRVLGAFELMQKIGFPMWAFHDYDLIDGTNGDLKELGAQLDLLTDIAKDRQDATGIKLAWNTNQFFALPIYMEGAGTSPYTAPFLRAVAQGKKSFEIANKLGAQNFVFWGGREGYIDLINTDHELEKANLALFLREMIGMSRRMGFKGQMLIEPKGKEPTEHQYDHDVTSVLGFLQKYGLLDEIGINFEPNHALLAGLSVAHELSFAGKWLKSIDINAGDPLTGWDIDLYTDPKTAFEVMRTVRALRLQGDFQTGVMNIDAKLRRTSTDYAGDLCRGMVKTADLLTVGLMQSIMETGDGRVAAMKAGRYAQWSSGIGLDLRSGNWNGQFEALADHVVANEAELVTPIPSGRVEEAHNAQDQATIVAPVVRAFRGVQG